MFRKTLSIILAFTVAVVSLSALGMSVVSAAAEYTYGYLSYEIDGGKEITITKCAKDAEGIVDIPERINNLPVTEVTDYSFIECQNLTGVIIPDGVKRIGQFAFYHCTSLATVDLGNGVTEIDWDAFAGCTSLESISFPYSISHIGLNAFGNCSSLASITIPDTVDEIRISAFGVTAFSENKANWKNGLLYINNCLIEADSSLSGKCTVKPGTCCIADGAFQPCSLLSEVVVPNGIVNIGESTFAYCESLKNVTLPNTLTKIGFAAFEGCKSLSNITIPDSMKSIGFKAFLDCTSLRSVIIPIGVTSIDYGALGYYSESGSYGDSYPINGFHIYCYKDSAGEQYAVENGFNYTIIELENYLVSFNFNGGQGSPASQTVAKGGLLTKPSTPTRADYTFKGWYANKQGTGLPWDFVRNKVTGSFTLYAIWKKDHTLTLNDVYNFDNYYDSFFKKGELHTYQISNEYWSILLKDKNIIEKLSIINNRYCGWGGSCVGIGISLALFNTRHLDPGFFPPAKQYPSELKPPIDAKYGQITESLINFYQLSQFADPYQREYNSDIEKCNTVILKELVTSVQQAETDSDFTLIIIGHYASSFRKGGHALMGYKVTCESNGDYKIHLLESNEREDLERSYMIVKSDFTNATFHCKWQYDGISMSGDTMWVEAVMDRSVYDAVNIQKALENNGYDSGEVQSKALSNANNDEVTLKTNCPRFTIHNNNGQTTTVSGSNYNGGISITSLSYEGNEASTNYIYTITDTSGGLTVTPDAAYLSADDAFTAVSYEGQTYASVSCKTPQSMAFTRGGAVTLNQSAAEKAVIHTALNSSTNPWYDVAVETQIKNITVTPTATNTVVSSTGALGQVTVTAENDFNSYSASASTSAKELTVKKGSSDAATTIALAQNDTVLAQTNVTYTVNFFTLGGSIVDSMNDVAIGAKAVQPAVPTKAGYLFAGWYTDTTYTKAWNFISDTVDGDVTLYAKWEVDPDPTRTVTFCADGSDNQMVIVSKGTVLTKNNMPAVPSKTGYAGAWNVADEITVTENITVNAVYTKLAVSGITVKTNPTATSYTVGGTLNTKGLTLTLKYSDGSTTVISSGFTCSPTKLSTVGAQKITVTYSGKTTSFTVKVLPKAPASVKAASVSYNSVKITWAAVSGATGYAVYRATSKTGTYSYVKSTTATSFTDTKLTPDKTYYYKVKAYQTIGETKYYSGYSAIVYAKAQTPAPTSLKAYFASYNSIKLTWTAVSGVTGYAIYRSTSKTGTFTYVKSVTSNSATDTKLSKDKMYYYKIRAYKTVGDKKYYSGYSSVVSIKTALGVPAGIKTIPVTYNSIKITWTAVSGASGYAVYRATSKTGTYSLIKSVTATNLTDTKLTAGKTYYYKVRAYKTVSDTKYYSAYSAIVSAKAVPAVPVSFTITMTNTTSVKTSWKAVASVTGYEVWMATSSNGTYSKLASTTKTTYTKTGLTKNKMYYFKVRAYKTIGKTKVYGAFTAVKTTTPSTKTEIYNFYQTAVNKIKSQGAAGHTRKEWQTIDALDIQSGALVRPIIDSYVKDESEAEETVSAKGSKEAKDRMAPCGAPITKIKSAVCVQSGNNYKITIVMNDEVNPEKGSNGVASMATGILYMEDVKNTIANDATVSKIVKSLDEDSKITYKAYTITAEITKDGKFIKLDHVVSGDIVAGADVVILGPISGTGTLTFHSSWYKFQY